VRLVVGLLVLTTTTKPLAACAGKTQADVAANKTTTIIDKENLNIALPSL
jgi:hypothetical protein